jgi:hypothetical protein
MRPRRLLVALALLTALVPAAGALAETDHTTTLVPGDSFEWNESAPAGLNINYFPWVPPAEPVMPIASCSKNPHYYCDTVLVNFTNPMTAEEIASGMTFKRETAQIVVGEFVEENVSDFDLRAFESDAEGTKGIMLGESGSGMPETITLSLRSTPEKGEHWVLIEVAYWSGIGGYTGTVTF